MERMNYTPDEIREALRYLAEQCGHLARSHAGNWRRTFTVFIDGMKNQEALKLFTRLLEGHQTANGGKWYRAAADRKAPPLPGDRYERCALVWKLVTMAMQKINPDGFDAREKIDLPYVLVNSDIPGGSLGEKFENWRLGWLEPFCNELGHVSEAILKALPASGQVDFWDASLAALTGTAAPVPAAVAVATASPAEPAEKAEKAESDAEGEAAAGEPKPKKKPAAKKKKAKE